MEGENTREENSPHAKPSTSLYHELSIDSSQDALRFFRFINDENTNEIRIEMQVFEWPRYKSVSIESYFPGDTECISSQTSQLRYTALSYVWGSPDDTEGIKVNGHVHSITRNLWEFLKVLHAETKYKERWFWADQICIDQRKLEERGLQVSKMDQVYYGAQEVFAYLGPEPDDSIYDRDTFLPSNWETDIPDQECFSGKNVKVLRSALDVFTRPYWTRLRILQEIFVASTIVMWCGSWAIKGDKVLDFCFRVSFFRDSRGKTGNTGLDALLPDPLRQNVFWQAIWLIFRSIQPTLHKHQQSLYDLLYLSEHSSCAEPRDRVYGLLAMVRNKEMVTIDYARPLELVALDTVRVCQEDILEESFTRYGTMKLEFRSFAALISKIAQRDMTSEVKALIWSRLAELMNSDSDLWSSYFQLPDFFCHIVRLITASAITAKQRACIADVGFDLSITLPDTEINNTARKFEEAAAQRGFVLYGKFVAHPDEWPFRDELPTGQLLQAARAPFQTGTDMHGSSALSSRSVHS